MNIHRLVALLDLDLQARRLDREPEPLRVSAATAQNELGPSRMEFNPPFYLGLYAICRIKRLPLARFSIHDSRCHLNVTP